MKAIMDKLELSYQTKKPVAQKFAQRLKEQLEEILFNEKVTLALWNNFPDARTGNKNEIKFINSLFRLSNCALIWN